MQETPPNDRVEERLRILESAVEEIRDTLAHLARRDRDREAAAAARVRPDAGGATGTHGAATTTRATVAPRATATAPAAARADPHAGVARKPEAVRARPAPRPRDLARTERPARRRGAGSRRRRRVHPQVRVRPGVDLSSRACGSRTRGRPRGRSLRRDTDPQGAAAIWGRFAGSGGGDRLPVGMGGSGSVPVRAGRSRDRRARGHFGAGAVQRPPHIRVVPGRPGGRRRLHGAHPPGRGPGNWQPSSGLRTDDLRRRGRGGSAAALARTVPGGDPRILLHGSRRRGRARRVRRPVPDVGWRGSSSRPPCGATGTCTHSSRGRSRGPACCSGPSGWKGGRPGCSSSGQQPWCGRSGGWPWTPKPGSRLASARPIP